MQHPIVTIGLEVHVQLKTHTKLFSPSPANFGDEPNDNMSIIDMGLPGVLPVLNREAVVLAMMLGRALNATINQYSCFARKNYFYPDLPKSYQITQDHYPIITDGHLTIDDKPIRIARAHLEEDAGKSIHTDSDRSTYIDLNRAGRALIEIVTHPEITSTQQALLFLKKLHHLVRYIDVCDGNMQNGSFRCDANVSIRYNAQDPLGTRVELKNINSFKFVEKAIDYEIQRQHMLISQGHRIVQETRLFNENDGKTYSMRDKENLADYRYFPDPDLPALIIDNSLLDEVKMRMPALPEVRLKQLVEQFDLEQQEAQLLLEHKHNETFFLDAFELSKTKSAKQLYNLMFGELAAYMNKHNQDIKEQPLKPQQLADLADELANANISQPMSKAIFKTLWSEPNKSVHDVISSQGLALINDEKELIELIQTVMAQSPQQLEQYRNGKDKLFGYFVGQVMKISEGKANPEKVNELLKQQLEVS